MPTLEAKPAPPSLVSFEPGKDTASPALRKVRRLKAVLVHAGARDAYQVAIALSEAGMLDMLVTDLFWSDANPSLRLLAKVLPAKFVSLLRGRGTKKLPRRKVLTSLGAGLKGLLQDRVRFLPFSFRQKLTRSADSTLGSKAGELARKRGAGLVSYSYYAFDAFKAYGQGGALFQMHPHPATMRRLLTEEVKMHPDCAESLQQEWELALPQEDFEHLVRETELAAHFLVASTFTRSSLMEHGVSEDRIDVIPYGVDLERFKPVQRSRSVAEPLQLLFVGRINQRKGLKYLLEALRGLDTDRVKLTICGRVLGSLDAFKEFGQRIEIRPSVSAEDLVRAYQSADLFVFPSIGEGFGQVLLEALASGLPVLSTTHTAAPDLIEDGVQGFVIEPRRPDLIADRISWALSHPGELDRMRQQARERAEQFTWERFRYETAASIRRFLAEQNPDSLEESI